MREREIEFSGKDGFKLKGTLCLPAGVVRGTALIIAGSGPTDRNGNSQLNGIPGADYLGEINTYREIAEQFAARGIATFRYDKRSCSGYEAQRTRLLASGVSAADFFAFSNIVDDAEKAAEMLAAQPEGKNLPLSILGHSEGGLVAMIVAGRQKNTDTLFLLAAGGRKLRDILKEQFFNRYFEQTGNKAGAEAFAAKADQVMQAVIERKPLPNNTPGGLKLVFNDATRVYFEQTLNVDPLVIARTLQSDVVVVNGTGDIQIDHEKDAEPLYKAFAERASKTARQDILKIEGASHCFKLPKDIADIAAGFKGPVAPQLFTALDPFIRRSGKPQ